MGLKEGEEVGYGGHGIEREKDLFRMSGVLTRKFFFFFSKNRMGLLGKKWRAPRGILTFLLGKSLYIR